MANESKEAYALEELDLDALNDVLRRIGSRLDALEGSHGTTQFLDGVNTNAGVSITDADGTVVHQLGTV